MMAYTHRVAWELLRGYVPDGKKVLHKCDNPPCVNPDHLYVGTQSDNVADMDRRGRRVRRGAVGIRNGSAKLTPDAVQRMRALHRDGQMTYVELAREFGVSETTVHRTLTRRNWANIA